MTEVINESSLQVARRKLASIVEIYAPLSVGREQTLQALTATLVEFEAAVREDERGIVALEALAAYEAGQLEAQNTSAPVVFADTQIEVVTPPPPLVDELTAPKFDVPTESPAVIEPKKKKGRGE